MQRKLDEYFEAGTRMVWYVHPQSRIVRVYTAPEQVVELQDGQTLDGGGVLTGFQLPLAQLFREAREKSQ